MSAERTEPVIAFLSAAEWRTWLDEMHDASTGLWLKIAKKGSGIDTVSYAEAVEVALCYCWIDSQKDKHDDDYFVQRFTPRKPRSKWSKINRDRVTELIGRGEMTPAGLREVESAKADGRWEAAYDSPRTATVPADLQRELDKDDRAREFFTTLNSANRYAILFRIHDAKRPETRARRIAKYVAMLSAQQKLHP